MTKSVYEKAESLKPLCWLENELKILTIKTSPESFGLDTPEDIVKGKEQLKSI